MMNGHIQYEVHYKDETPIILKSKSKYNTGKKVKVLIAKKYFNKADIAFMKIEVDALKENLEETKRDVPRNAILKVKKSKFYFGGVPPNYTTHHHRLTEALHTHQSLLGEINDVISHQAIALMDNSDENKGYHDIIETKCDEVRIY